MQVFKFFSVATLVFVVSVGALQSKSLRNVGEPAEFPPSSFKGNQYIDSKGCVFIRAGMGGSVTWVPRVSRSRQQICRQSPTFARAPKPDVAVVADRAPAPAAKPTQIRVAAPKPAPAPKRVVRAPVVKPAPQPKRIVRRVVQTPVVAAPKPIFAAKPVAAPKPIKRRVAQPAARQTASPCQSGSTYSRTYTNSSGSLAVRCGAQVEDPTGGYVYNAPTNYAPTARVPRSQTRRVAAPKPMRATAIAAAYQASNTAATQRIVRIIQPTQTPAGYQRVWSDGRLNTNRARGTAAGRAEMEMVWTNTVPRRLVAISTSQDTRRRIVIQRPSKAARNATVVSTKSVPIKRRTQSAATSGGDR